MSLEAQMQSKLDEGWSVLEVATHFRVTQPFVRKRLNIPNPDVSDEALRCHLFSHVRQMIDEELPKLYEPRMITPDHTSRFIEALIVMTDARQVLELGMYSGYTTLQMLKAIVGKPNAKVVAVDPAPVFDREFFAKFGRLFEFVEGKTPDCLYRFKEEGRIFDLVFIDSDHTVAHIVIEILALWPITRPGSVFLFHDCPFEPPDIYQYLESKVASGTFKGAIFPTAPQQDVTELFGPNNEMHRPNLGVFLRQ